MTEKVITLTYETLNRFKARVCYVCGKALRPGDVVVRRDIRRAERRLVHKECWDKVFVA